MVFQNRPIQFCGVDTNWSPCWSNKWFLNFFLVYPCLKNQIIYNDKDKYTLNRILKILQRLYIVCVCHTRIHALNVL